MSVSPERIISGGATGRNRMGLYSTPEECTEALIQRIDWRAYRIMEPCAGAGAITKYLARRGYEIGHAGDIDPQSTEIKKECFLSTFSSNGCQAIITNPPFSLFEDFLKHSINLGIERSAWLLKVNVFSAVRRERLFREIGFDLKLDLLWRPDFLGGGSPTMDCCWMVRSGPERNGCLYDVLPKPCIAAWNTRAGEKA